MATRTRRISHLRPLILIVSAMALALIIERFSFPSIPFTLSANDPPFNAVFSELMGSESTLWSADPTDPQGRRKTILTVSHAYGYGVVASVSPDGARLAYGFLPEGQRDAFADGQLWVVAMDGQNARLISGKMDLHFTPIWSPDGKRLLYKMLEILPSVVPTNHGVVDQVKPTQRPLDQNFRSSLMVVSVDGPAIPKSLVSLKEQDVFPIGWSPDGTAAYFYTVEVDGSKAQVVDVSTSGVRNLGQLAGSTAWEVRLSPDRRRFLYLTLQSGQPGPLGTTWVFDPEIGRASVVSSPQIGPIGAIWLPNGSGITRSGAPDSVRPAPSIFDTDLSDGTNRNLRESPDGTISIPVSWSPDSTFLAVRQHSVPATGQLDNLAFLDTRSGQIKQIKGGYAELAGWTTYAK